MGRRHKKNWNLFSTPNRRLFSRPGILVAGMLTVIIGVLTVRALMAASLTYYIDCNVGSDSNSGQSQSTAWRNVSVVSQKNLGADDTVYLARGCTWTSPMSVPQSGQSGHLLSFKPYGTGSAPTINNLSNQESSAAITVSGSYVSIEGVRSTRANGAGVFITSGASYNVVKDSEFSGTGYGVYLTGNHALITNNKTHD
jgi:hypothetical protein